MRLEEMMTRDYATLKPEDSLLEAVRLLRNSQRDGLPVLDSDNTLAGVFTKTNLYDALMENKSLDQPVRGFYNKNVVKIKQDLTYDQVINAVRRIPVGTGVVVDGDDNVVGLFTKVELITALFKEEQLLNARMNAMCQAMHNALVTIDENSRINFINRSAEQLFNIDYKTALGRSLEEVLPELKMELILRDGIIEIGADYKYGNITTMVNKTPLLDNGKAIGALAIFQDITELESIAEEMGTVKRLNQTLRTVLDIGYDALVVVNEEGNVVLVNRTFLDFIGLQEKDVMHCPISGVLENSRLHVIVKTGIPEINDIQFIDGKPYVVSRLPIVRDGQVIGAVGKISFRRVDELRELAGRLETMNSRLTHFQEELKKARIREQLYSFEDIITINPGMRSLIGEARQAAAGLSTVLVSGESGVGKELMAQAIHQASPRRDQPFIKVNCAAIPENLLESEFFGYVKGAFTGASEQGKKGKLDLANGGTLFLDEIGDMPASLQGKLLRVLQEQAYERVGDTSTVRVDIRFIAATNHDLDLKVREGSFRKDLYFRLNVIPIPIPPLRQRPEDILPLAHAFLRKYNDIFGMQVSDLTPEALAILKAYTWPGNVRELENVIERALNFTAGEFIKVEHLPSHMRVEDFPGDIKTGTEPVSNRNKGNNYRSLRIQHEKEAIREALSATGGNKSEAAKMLGISRSWLYKKMKQLAIEL